MLMVKAGKRASIDFIETLLPHLEEGDLIIDGGNSHFPDTIRRDEVPGRERDSLHRHRRLRRRGRRAHGPSHHARRQSRGLAAGQGDLPVDRRQDARRRALLRLGGRRRRRPLRQDGPQRHRVRRHAAHLRGLSAHEAKASACRTPEMHDVFKEWNEGELDSYLIEITRDILGFKDDRTASMSSTRSSTPPARRAPASGPASARSISASR